MADGEMERIDQGRRRFLKGAGARSKDTYLISSAVVRAFPDRAQSVAAAIAKLDGAEVSAVQDSKIVILIEGSESGAIGATLAQIAMMDHVLAANLVYEHAVNPSDGEEDAAHPA